MALIFMRDPAAIFLKLLKPRPWERRWYELGMSAMALEIVTRIKVLESIPVASELGRQEAISALQTILTELELVPEVYELYEEINRRRQPQFSPDASLPAPSLLESDDAAGPWPRGRSDGSSS